MDTAEDWVATVQTSKSLPFHEWSLILRNPALGQSRTVARSVPEVVNVPNLEPKLPYGFAPAPSISGGRVVWDALVIDHGGNPKDRVYLYNIGANTTELLYEVQDPTVNGEEVYWPTIGGNRVAWVRRPTPTSDFEIVVRELDTGREQTIRDVGGPYSASLSDDGRYLAWDNGMFAKWSLNLDTGERVQYAGYYGWGTHVSGHYVSWVPRNQPGGKGGFYDFNTGEVRLIEIASGTNMNAAAVLGDWFMWQVKTRGSSDGGTFYFVPLKAY